MVLFTTAAIGSSVLKLIEKPLGELYQNAKGEIKTIIGKWNIAGQKDKITQKILEVERVRTITSHRLIPLSDFYYPSKLRVGKTISDSKSVNEISETQNILILGTVGQGKSVYMRHLCIAELRIGKKIPVFIELRYIDSDTNLESLLFYNLNLLGLTDISQEIFSYILSQGAFVFFLDGFDEIKREYALNVQKKLAELSKNHPQTKWIVSSRPGSFGDFISPLSNFTEASLEKITLPDFENFFKALKVEDDLREKLLNAIKKCPAQIQQVLTTPLMLTLLNMTFGTSTNIPDTLHEFYETMFHVLVSRHDETKAGYIRQKVTKLSTGELQNVFEHFCYLSKDYGNSLSDEQFATCAKKAAKLTNLEFSAEGLKAELSETLCLMMKEGLKTSFIHKSVQEFFAAYFVKKLGNEESVKKIYAHLVQSKFISWTQELRFLAEIDKYRYLEHFRLPDMQNFQNCFYYKASAKTKITKENFKRFISSLEIYIIFPKVDSKNKIKFVLLELSTLTPTLNEWISFLQQTQKFNYTSLDGIKAHFENMPDTQILRPIRLDRYLREHPEENKQWFSRLIEFSEKLEKEKIKNSKILEERRQSFSEILGL